ncbi:hypothetical protein CEB3_c19450 [Peptococcaceae bacterium CEB3]|nr:hypothetical protein CEB3_c19450 [Peptococcaceae bacterium CEB3]
MAMGKGNPDWNFSAPHGAGRLMSRRQAKEVVTMREFEESMRGIFTTSVGTSTLDESPMDEILGNIRDTMEVLSIVKPIYNFKAGS